MTSTTAFDTHDGVKELPGEVTDYIIDFLHDDIDSLKTCALIARAWTGTAHFHVFRTWPVVCRQDEPDRSAGELLKWAASDSAGTREVATLIIEAARPSGTVTHTLPIGDLGRLMPHMPNVRNVTLQNVVLDAPPTVQSTPDSRRLSLARLSILACKTPEDSFTHIGHLLCLFPVIDRLYFAETVCGWDECMESEPWFTPLLSALRIGELDMHCVEEAGSDYHGYTGIVCLLQRADPTCWPLRRLGMAFPQPFGTPPIYLFLTPCAKCLSDLAVDVLPSVLRRRSLRGFYTRELQACTSLKILRLSTLALAHSDGRISDGKDAQLYGADSNALQSNVELVEFVPPQLEHIVISVFHSASLDAETQKTDELVLRSAPDWAPLDEALSRLTNLKSIVCVVAELEEWEGYDVEGRIDEFIRAQGLLETGSLPGPLLALSETSADAYIGLLCNAFPRAASARRLHIAVMS
ncbi:hypothetical protein L226DRAFT_144434 [Lentinus tigrinus ALCF2SS1-7]|uniref:F-box domain-containing protein n=1 Tax=Lentinus tigrinus ALCF2SS1-6 TaxID=1328759 RepID=A0A5C2RPL5_9APHY|nr:hypothetical protein L227DRAFT_617116 [Lentinus tigrinus ALCF2SS1-6]RPD72699.1 hypothetical protein L226DRAFT_144434 [Lentinus tigrinus ALCF2SS1-7]